MEITFSGLVGTFLDAMQQPMSNSYSILGHCVRLGAAGLETFAGLLGNFRKVHPNAPVVGHDIHMRVSAASHAPAAIASLVQRLASMGCFSSPRFLAMTATALARISS